MSLQLCRSCYGQGTVEWYDADGRHVTPCLDCEGTGIGPRVATTAHLRDVFRLIEDISSLIDRADTRLNSAQEPDGGNNPKVFELHR